MISLIRKQSWDYEFNIIKNYLLTKLEGVLIEHIGSTSIPGLLAKPIIDIDVIIDDINEVPFFNEELASLGYVFQGDLGVIGRYAYKIDNNSLPEHHLYLCISSQKGLVEHLIFRNYLMNNPEKRLEYENVKLSLSHLDSDEYCLGKTDFIKKCLLSAGYQEKEYEVIYPDFKHSLINVTSSIQKYFGHESKYSSLPILDQILYGSKHVVMLILDGFGINILNYHLKVNSFLRRHQKDTITSIFPPTTAAATTALQSGLLPGETGWIGWQQYFSEVDQNIVLFRNVDYYSHETISFDVVQKKIAYKPFASQFQKAYTVFPNFIIPDGPKDFRDLCKRLEEITNLDEVNYTYAYWDKPDELLHIYGCYAEEINDNVNMINDYLENMSQNLGKDTTLIITADHGLIDVAEINLNQFKDITKYFRHKPSNEGRAMSFYVNNPDEFKVTFNKYFQSYFDLYTQDEFIKLGLLGNKIDKAKEFLGDFIAIAKREFYFNPKDISQEFKAAHAGLTKEEMLVPLIIYRN